MPRLKAFADLDRNVRRGIFDHVVPKPGDLQGRARSRRVVHWMLALSCTHNAEPQAQHRRDTTLLRNIVQRSERTTVHRRLSSRRHSSDPSSKETGHHTSIQTHRLYSHSIKHGHDLCDDHTTNSDDNPMNNVCVQLAAHPLKRLADSPSSNLHPVAVAAFRWLRPAPHRRA